MQNVVATYLGVALFVVLYVGYVVYERCVLGRRGHLVPLLEVDLDTDAVWRAGDAVRFREAEAHARAGVSWWGNVCRRVVAW